MATPLRVGVLGAGPWARMVTGPVLGAGPQTAVSGVWSRTAEHAASLAASLEAPAFDDIDELIDTADAVAIAVAPAAQPELAERVAAAGKPMLLEKPLGADLAGARRVRDAVHRAGVGALVTLSNRFNPALARFADQVRTIEALGGRGCFVSGAFLGGPFAQGWRLERGALLDVGPHLLDLLEAALGEIVAIRAAGDPLGWVSLVCEHESGATSSGSICCAAATEGRTEVEVFGRKGVAYYDGRVADFDEWTNCLRDAFVSVAHGASHPANVDRLVHLQELIEQAEEQVR